MTESRAAPAGSTLLAFESIGIACARASLVAVAVGAVEGLLLARSFGAKVPGIALATAGLWVPAAFLAVLLTWPVRRAGRRGRAILFAVLAVGLGAALAWAHATHLSGMPRAAPAELAGALLIASGASSLELDGVLRRVCAVSGVALVLLLQVHSNRWIDAHRAYAGAIAQGSLVPRVMLRDVLRRVL